MTNTLIDEYLEQAFPLCMELPRQKKHLSFILHKNRIVATGRNFFKTHPKAKVIGYAFDEMHSELDAYRKVPRNLRDKKLTLLNVRLIDLEHFVSQGRVNFAFRGVKKFFMRFIILQIKELLRYETT